MTQNYTHAPTGNVPLAASRLLRQLIVSIGPCCLCSVLSVTDYCVCLRCAFVPSLDASFRHHLSFFGMLGRLLVACAHTLSIALRVVLLVSAAHDQRGRFISLWVSFVTSFRPRIPHSTSNLPSNFLIASSSRLLARSLL
ncbi:hypothetical protein V8D89_010637 [Ganoderma adspersum]